MTEPLEILELFGKRPQTIRPGLGRTREAWQLLGEPGANLKTILVAGTNGKGSTSGLLWHLLSGAGYRVGHFSSPHLINFRERINMSFMDVTNEMLVADIRKIRAQLPTALWDELTFFEINTLLALSIFSAAAVDFNVMEVGLGGRLDSTNIVNPSLSIITNIGIDHVVYLGETTDLIAREKAGIMRPGVPCIWGGEAASDSASHQVILDTASNLKVPLKIAGRDFALAASESVFVQNGADLPWPRLVSGYPSYLRANYAMAFAAFYELLLQQRLPTGEIAQRVREATENFGNPEFKWPVTLWGRFQKITIIKGNEKYKLLLDVCHNPHGAKAFARGLEETGLATASHPKPAFLSILSDKDAGGIWNALKGRISDVLRFRINSERSWTADSHAVPGAMFDSFSHALRHATGKPEWSRPENQPWIVCGSVAGIGEVLSNLRADEWTIEPCD